jgi:hypothetical protein
LITTFALRLRAREPHDFPHADPANDRQLDALADGESSRGGGRRRKHAPTNMDPANKRVLSNRPVALAHT